MKVSNNLGKSGINFSIAIHREQLRPTYKDGFKGALLVTFYDESASFKL